VILNALESLTEAALIMTVPMDDDIFYRMSEVLNPDELQELEMALNNIQVYANDVRKPASEIAAPVAASAPAPSPVIPLTSFAAAASVEDAGEGKVAQRNAQQKNESIAYLMETLKQGPAPKLAVSEGIVELFTARGAKELLAEMIENGQIEEFRESKTKFLRLKGGAVATKPAAVAAATVAPKAKPDVTGTRDVDAVAPRVTAEVVNDTPASKVEPVVSAPRHQPAPAPAAAVVKPEPEPAPVREHRAVAPAPAQAHQSVNAFEQLLAGLPQAGADSHFMVSNALTQLAGYVRQLETENKVYKELFGQMQVSLKHTG
jgi:hypothetical protein